MFPYHTLNIGGRLFDLSHPQVMGIINLTPDSFYASSRCLADEKKLTERVLQIVAEGGTMIDVGACSTRPGGEQVSQDEEMKRLRTGLNYIVKALPQGVALSVDTYRADVAKMCVEEFGVHIINDISGGDADKRMFQVVADLHTPYIIMYHHGHFPFDNNFCEADNLTRNLFMFFSSKINLLHELGVCDVIIDPGFGFTKTREQDFAMLRNLQHFAELDCPVLVGMSRKRMVYETLGCSPEESLQGTTAVNTIALERGATILRVHDVHAAVSALKMVTKA